MTGPSQLYVTTMNRSSPVDWRWCAVLKAPATTTYDRDCHRWRRRRQFCCSVMKVTGTSARCWPQLDTTGPAEQLQWWQSSLKSNVGLKPLLLVPGGFSQWCLLLWITRRYTRVSNISWQLTLWIIIPESTKTFVLRMTLLRGRNARLDRKDMQEQHRCYVDAAIVKYCTVFETP